MNPHPSFIQWNCGGLYSKISSFKKLISEFNPIHVSIQETKFKVNYRPNFKHFKTYYKNIDDGINAHGGVMTLVNEMLVSNEVQLNTNFQAIAVEIYFPFKHIVCNVYFPGNEPIDEHDLDELIGQLGNNFILIGDFNAHNTLWGSRTTNSRGKLFEDFVERNNLIILNNGQPTFMSHAYGTFSSIDLSIVSGSLGVSFDWCVLENSYLSDHFPIVAYYANQNDMRSHKRISWNLDKADWSAFKNNLDFSNLDFSSNDIDSLTQNFSESILKAAESSVPLINDLNKKRKLPWWNNELKKLVVEKIRKFRIFKEKPSIENLIAYKKAQCLVRKRFREESQKSWRDYVSSINSRVNVSEIFDKLRRINGNKKRMYLQILRNGDQMVTNHLEMCEILANHYERVYSDQDLDPDFAEYKALHERFDIFMPEDFVGNYFNLPFTRFELLYALSDCKGSSPGPDNIHYDFIKKLDETGIDQLLRIMNKIWIERVFPKKWKLSLIVPIPKQGKDFTLPNNTRPINLTNCPCKLMERMVNRRLVYFIEKNKRLNQFQSGSRRNRSTIDNLVFLENQIVTGFAKQEHTVAIFFDCEKAYDRTWRRFVIKSLIDMGINGNMLHFLYNLINERTFQTMLGETRSSIRKAKNGIVQGSVVGGTLFCVGINKIFDVIGTNAKAMMYVDDLVILVSHKDLNFIQNMLQNILDRLSRWCKKSGFKFNEQKTVAMLFTRKIKNVFEPDLYINDKNIRYVKEFKYLGMTFDSKLSWNAHIKDVTSRAEKAINVLKMVSSNKYGSDRNLMLKLHKIMFLPVINYGSFVFYNTSQTNLSKLNSICNKSLRYATGAFRTSPIESLLIDAGEKPLKYQMYESMIRYSLKILSSPDNPLFHEFENLIIDNRMTRKRTQPFVVRSIDTAIRFDIQMNFNYDINKFHEYFPWSKRRFNFDFSLTRYDKNFLSNIIFQRLFSEMCQKYVGYTFIFTDGSVIERKTGAAFHMNGKDYSFRLLESTSIFTAELYAIYRAILVCENDNNNCKFVLFSDSLSSLQSLQDPFSKNSLVQKIQDIVQTSRKVFCFAWIPGHKGIHGNEKADMLAKNAIHANEIENYYHFKDLYKKVKNNINNEWENDWLLIPVSNKLRDIKDTIDKFKMHSELTKKESSILTRLRIGHTRLTHSYLFETPQERPMCECGEILTVKHIFENCNNLVTLKQRHGITGINDLINENCNKIILEFLKDADIYNKI